MDSPEGEAVEVFRLEPTACMPSFHFENSRLRRDPLESASKVARALLRAVSAQIETGRVNFDKLLADGAVCTIRFIFGTAGAISCLLLLKGAAQADTELVRLKAPPEVKSFSFLATIAELETGIGLDHLAGPVV